LAARSADSVLKSALVGLRLPGGDSGRRAFHTSCFCGEEIMSQRSSTVLAVVLSLAANIAAEEPPPARKIIDQAIEAAGGREALAR
jgi:hypothetical protein